MYIPKWPPMWPPGIHVGYLGLSLSSANLWITDTHTLCNTVISGPGLKVRK